MKTTISVSKVITESVEMEFPIAFQAKNLNMFHYFASPESRAFTVYNLAGDYKCESKGVDLDYVLTESFYEPCPLDIFFQNYAEARFAMDTILDFSQTYLNLTDHE
jgi:hypothetical protein